MCKYTSVLYCHCYKFCHVLVPPLLFYAAARLTKLCAKQLQSQDSLARHVLHALQTQLAPQGALVVVQARHLSYTSQQPPAQQTAAAASGCLAGKAAAGAVCLHEALELLGLQINDADVQLLPDPAALMLAGPSSCICSGVISTAGRNGACAGCGGSSRLVPHILRGMSASAAGGMDSPRAPVTPDPSENDDTDGSEQGSDLYCQQLLGGLSSSSRCCEELAAQGILSAAGTSADADGSSSSSSSESMETALMLLLAETGVDVVNPAVQAAVRRHVLAMLAATAGYHQQLPRSWAQQQQQQHQSLEQSAGGSCACCCDSGLLESQQQQQQQQRQGVHQASELLDLEHTQQQQQCEWVEHHVPFMSQCEHHMLPFHGTVHITYALNRCSSNCTAQQQQQRALSEAEAAQLVRCFTQRLQVQERITHQVAEAVQQLLQPAGVMVVISAAHMCMVARGVENHAGSTSTRAAFGVFERDAKLRCKVLRKLSQQQQQQQ
jgi:GTP cyclohydrolase I